MKAAAFVDYITIYQNCPWEVLVVVGEGKTHFRTSVLRLKV